MSEKTGSEGGNPMKLYLALILMGFATQAAAQKKPFVEPGTQPGPSDPKYTDGILPGDQWAVMRINVDERGQPTRCGIAKTNIRSKETRYWMCQAMLSDWHIEPIMRDGVAVPGTVTRRVVMPGRRHPKKK